MLPVRPSSSSGPCTSCTWIRGAVMGSFAPLLIPRKRTSCTDPTADTTTACFTPAAWANSTRRRCRLSPGAILMTKRRPCSTSLNQSPSISFSGGARERRLEARLDRVIERAAVAHAHLAGRVAMRGEDRLDLLADEVLELPLHGRLDLDGEPAGGLDEDQEVARLDRAGLGLPGDAHAC